MSRALLTTVALLAAAPASASKTSDFLEKIMPTTVHDEGCSFSWRALGCVPSADCKLKLKLRLGSLGPCVKKPPAPAEEESKPPEPEPEAAKPAEEAAPAAAEEEKKEEEPAAAAEEEEKKEE